MKDNDTWVPIFIKDTIRTAFETPLTPPPAETASETTPGDAPAGGQMAQDVTLAKLLLQGALEVYREKIDALTVKPTPPPVTGPVSAEEVKQDEPDPKKAEAVDEFSVWGTSTSKKDKKKKSSIWGPKLVLEPAEEKSIELLANNVQVTDLWATKKGKITELELEQPPEEPEPVPVEEPKVVVEPAVDDVWAVWGTKTKTSKKDKKKKKGKIAELEPELERPKEPELESVPEVIPEPEPEKKEEDVFWGSSTTLKKDKKKIKRAEPELDPPKEPEPVLMDEPEVVAELAPDISLIEKGWVGGELDPWSS